AGPCRWPPGRSDAVSRSWDSMPPFGLLRMGKLPRARSLARFPAGRPAREQRAQRGDEGDRLVEHQVMAGFGDLDAGRARRRLRALPCDHALVHQLRLAAPDDGDGAARGVEADGRVAVAILRPEGRIEAPGHARRGLRHLAQRATRDVVHGVEVLAVLWGEEAV